MTTNTTELQRSTLERKDRTELHTIAVAMGGKPGSRARKAEIVDLILGLAGIEETSPDGNGAAPAADTAAEATTESAAATAAPAEESATESDNAGAAQETTTATEESAAATEDSAAATEDPTTATEDSAAATEESAAATEDSAAAKDDNQGQQDKGQGQQGQGQQGQGQQGQGQQGQGQQGRGRQKNANQGQQKGQNQGQQKGGDNQPESGNRKRRRRGRDRDRDRTEEPWQGEPVEVEGYLDLRDEGYGFLRVNGSLPSKEDVYVSVKQVRQFGMRRGDHLKGGARPANRNEKNPALLRVDLVNEADPEVAKSRPKFESLTPLFPDEKLNLERTDDPTNMTARIIDLIAPIGKGQRGLIVSPPKAGKTTIMKEIARSIEANNPEVKLLVLLVDERPEEVTDMKRWLAKGEVVASTFDRPSDEHAQVAELTIERAKRMVESGEDVVIILDGITRLARAYNLAAPATGRIMSGGVDSGALYPPKRFFGAARNVEEGGSLTILATALVETGSKMDEVIFEEFKGTGNMELRLDRKTAERRIYPAIDVDASSTRHEELLFERKELQQVWKLRRVLSGLASDGNGGGAAGLELLIDRLKTFPTNGAFLDEVARGPMNA